MRTRVLQANLFNLTDIKYILSEFDGVNKPDGKYMYAISLKYIHSTTMLSSYLHTNAKVCVGRSLVRAPTLPSFYSFSWKIVAGEKWRAALFIVI